MINDVPADKKVNYELLTSECKTDGAEGAAVYGLRAVRFDIRTEFIEFADVSCNREAVAKLVLSLEDNEVPIDQISYIVEDYIAEL